MPILLAAVSQATGGIISDMQTLTLGIIGCLCICVGLDFLRDVMVDMGSARSSRRDADEAEKTAHWLGQGAGMTKQQVQSDIAKSRYKKSLRGV